MPEGGGGGSRLRIAAAWDLMRLMQEMIGAFPYRADAVVHLVQLCHTTTLCCGYI